MVVDKQIGKEQKILIFFIGGAWLGEVVFIFWENVTAYYKMQQR